MKTIWIVSGGAEAIPGIIRAKELGLHVVVSDGNESAPGFEYADDSVVASTYDIDATVQAAYDYSHNNRKIDGVISIASDVPVTVAAVAHELGLPGISVETARLACDKLAMKQRFAENSIPIPWFSEIESLKQLQDIIDKRGYPLIIKPVDSRGARGVLRLLEQHDLAWAYNYSKSYSPMGRVMVEEYLSGIQVSTEALIVNGQGFTSGFSDRNYEYLDRFSPYIIENGGHQPSVLAENDQLELADTAVKAGLAMGIQNGVAKGDMVMTADGPKVIEIAARLSGGWFCTDQIPLGTGVDLVGSAIKLALGEDLDTSLLKPQWRKGVAIRYFFPPTGKIKSIENTELFSQCPWVYKIGFFVKPGDEILTVTDHTKRAGYVITTGDTRDEAIDRAQEVISAVRIVTI
ncbi:MAG: ATP-grasp domain-containing protein [Desulfuromonadales bacterium]